MKKDELGRPVMRTQGRYQLDQGQRMPRREAPFRRKKPRSDNPARSDPLRPTAPGGWRTLATVVALIWAIGIVTLLAQCSGS